MCTFILAWRAFPESPVVVAANRDEALDRPSEPPGPLPGHPGVFAPRDGEAGGTWLGHNDDGVLVGVTNRWTETPLDGERSRGLLVADALDRESAEAAGRFVERAVRETAYAGFNLVVVDADAALLYEWDGRLSVTPLDPGVHVVGNVGADGTGVVPARREEPARAQIADARRAMATLRPEPGESAAAWRGRARDLLRDHEYGFCVHGEGFGTRSSSLVTLGADGGVDYEFADGPPCETAFRRVDGQL